MPGRRKAGSSGLARSKLTEQTIGAMLIERFAFPDRAAAAVARRLLVALRRSDPAIEATPVDELIEGAAIASVRRAALRGFLPPVNLPVSILPASFTRSTPASGGKAAAFSIVDLVVAFKDELIEAFDDLTPPRIMSLTDVETGNCCDPARQGKVVRVTGNVEIEEPDDFGYTGGLDRVLVEALNPANGNAVPGADNNGTIGIGGGPTGTVMTSFALCVPCFAIDGKGLVNLKVTAFDGRDNKAEKQFTIMPDPDKVARCCR